MFKFYYADRKRGAYLLKSKIYTIVIQFPILKCKNFHFFKFILNVENNAIYYD